MFRGARTIAAAALCLIAAAVPSRAAAPAVSVTALSTGSINISWTGGTSPFTAQISTDSAFNVWLASGQVTGSATNYPFLSPDTSYYLRVRSSGDAIGVYGSTWTVTPVAAPSGMYSISAYFTAPSSHTAVNKIGWNVNGNPEWTGYELSYADNAAFTGETVSPIGYPPADQGGLYANTVYYFRVRARGISGMVTPYASYITTATAAMALTGLYDEVFESSAVARWTPENGSVQAQRAEGYTLTLSTSELMSPVKIGWSTADRAVSSYSLEGLGLNTTYFYRVGSLNVSGLENLSDKMTFTTLAQKPQGLAFMSVADGAARLGWTALPSAPSEASALGYTLQASTAADWTGIGHSSSAYSVAQSTLALTTLDPNTTYYFHVASLNSAGDPNYNGKLSTVTLSLSISTDLVHVTPGAQRMDLTFTPLPLYPQAFACEGYRLEASTGAFGGGAAVISSVTYDPSAQGISVEGLNPNTVYNLRLGALNWERTPHYVTLASTRTTIPGVLTGVTQSSVWSSSVAVSFNPGIATEGYVAQASLYRYFSVVAASSATANPAASALAIQGLDPNTAYYFRAGSLYNGATVYTEASPLIRQTLPLAVMLGAPPYAGVFYSSATVAWTPLAAGPQKDTAEGYRLEASTASDFSGVLLSSAALSVAPDRLTVSGLAPNTTYYFRNASLNLEGRPNYASAGSTATLANVPTQQDFVLTPASINLNWLVNGNPPDTVYLVEMDDDPGFASPEPSSSTVLSSATFSGLLPTTTYYSRVTAYNRFGRAAPTVSFSPMATGAHDPAAGSPSAIGPYTLTANWGQGANGAGIFYRATISSSTDFSGVVLSSSTQNLYASFSGLVSNASYYLRVSALNLSAVPTLPAIGIGTALTLPTTPYMLPPEQAFTGPLIDGFTLNWLDNGNSSFTHYGVEISTCADFFRVSTSTVVHALSHSFRDLLTGTTYYARVRAIGQAGDLSAFESSGSTMTISSSTLNAVAMRESYVTLETSYGTISLYLPRGSIGSSTRIILQPETSFGAPNSAVSALTPTGIGLRITHFPATLVLGAVTITLPYRITDLPSAMRDTASRSKLVLALFDETNSIWVPLPSVSDTANNKVTSQTWHLSTFQLMQASSETGLAAVKIYPNPYRPNSVSDVMHFTNMTPYAKVRIYTFLGELVREIKADVNGMAAWDGLNSDGRKVASGVYIAYVQTRDKRSSKSFKVAIER